MASSGPSHFTSSSPQLPCQATEVRVRRQKITRLTWGFIALTLVLIPVLFAQGSPQVTSVDPASGKVNDALTLTGTNLDKASVTAVFLSDDKDDYKSTIQEQSAQKIVVKVPQVKPGAYNISIQVGEKLYIKPVKFTVDQ